MTAGGISQFFREVKGELAKVVWPKQAEFVGSTIIVLFLVFLFAVYFYGVDSGLNILVEKIFKWYGLYEA